MEYGPPTPLTPVNVARLIEQDIPFTAVVESRRSVRDSTLRLIRLEELSEFLYRVARIRRAFEWDGVQYTDRPYPSGGASYELELYLTINKAAGIDRGVYYYNPALHALQLVCLPNPLMEELLLDAWNSKRTNL